MRGRTAPCDEGGQMAVELAAVLPVILLVMVITIDCMVFMAQSARFDHVAAQQVLALASSPSRDRVSAEARVEEVQEALSTSFSHAGQTVTVECTDARVPLSSMVVFECTLRMPPWPLAQAGSMVFGTTVPLHLEHRLSFVIDPYTPGELL